MLPQICNLENWRNQSGRPISPLVGEMSGRTEGGVIKLDVMPRFAER
jgi:hypothetical protein